MASSSSPRLRLTMDRPYKDSTDALDRGSVLRRPGPGRLFGWVKVGAWVESALFAALLVVWLAPGMDQATFVLGLSHGIGYLALCALILAATVARESPWPLLAASLTPAGPFGT